MRASLPTLTSFLTVKLSDLTPCEQLNATVSEGCAHLLTFAVMFYLHLAHLDRMMEFLRNQPYQDISEGWEAARYPI